MGSNPLPAFKSLPLWPPTAPSSGWRLFFLFINYLSYNWISLLWRMGLTRRSTALFSARQTLLTAQTFFWEFEFPWCYNRLQQLLSIIFGGPKFVLNLTVGCISTFFGLLVAMIFWPGYLIKQCHTVSYRLVIAQISAFDHLVVQNIDSTISSSGFYLCGTHWD